jgi:putative oxidoreductase
MTILRNIWLQRAVGLIVGLVFAYASLDKIWRPDRFAEIVYRYQILGPNAWIPPLVPNLFAVTLPWIEIVAGLALICGVWRRESALLTGLMLTMFIIAVGWTLHQGIDIENCGCFSLSEEGRRAGWALILEDVLLLMGAALLVFLPPRAKEPGPPIGGL